MKKIQVKHAFILNLPGEQKQFAVGVHEVEDDIAEHRYVKHHSAPLVETSSEELAPTEETSEYEDDTKQEEDEGDDEEQPSLNRGRKGRR